MRLVEIHWEICHKFSFACAFHYQQDAVNNGIKLRYFIGYSTLYVRKTLKTWFLASLGRAMRSLLNEINFTISIASFPTNYISIINITYIFHSIIAICWWSQKISRLLTHFRNLNISVLSHTIIHNLNMKIVSYKSHRNIYTLCYIWNDRDLGSVE